MEVSTAGGAEAKTDAQVLLMPRLKANDTTTKSNLQGIATCKLLSQLAAEHGELFYVVLTYKCLLWLL